MIAYCVKCKEKREVSDPEPVFTRNGSPGTKGVCSVCGTKIFRMGRTDAHVGMIAPKVEKLKKVKKVGKRVGKLVIVESPAKARTINRFLGKNYTVKASVGHVRDLLRSQISVDVDNNFKPKYRVPNDKRAIVKEIKALAKNAQEIYLATDPDREGEAIAWHLLESAEMESNITRRLVFHEITQTAIEEAFLHPSEIRMDLVNAQQTRRILDRLVGYNLSPLLWGKVRSRLSAGRVQSVALRIIVEREAEINAFISEEFWTISALFQSGELSSSFSAKLSLVDGKTPELYSQSVVEPLVEDIKRSICTISKIKRGTRRRSPSAPFTTSSMQQDASNRLGFSTKKTMAIAQQLYEGIDSGNGGTTGFITYMRTDSTNISSQAQNEAREFILRHFGKPYLPKNPPKYQTKARNAQEAHEAIRPTLTNRKPEEIKAILTRDQYRLYTLIWKRFVASQMEAAVYETLKVDIEGKSPLSEYLFRAAGSCVVFPGFLTLYEEMENKEANFENGEGINIPPEIREGLLLDIAEIKPEQHFTQPPPRFTEASLVKTLEENGIGRPSTYAPILTTLQSRGYVVRENKRLTPTEIGTIVNDLITEYFPDIIDIGFTANMENDLDAIASGEKDWVSILREFYDPFSARVEVAQAEMPEVKPEQQLVGRQCPECGKDLVLRWGRYGKFISCNGFPDCRYTEPWLVKTGVNCPLDGGEVVERRTRKGKIFYGCENYPVCNFTSWKRPINVKCPECKGLLVLLNRQFAQCINCEEKILLDSILSEEPEIKA